MPDDPPRVGNATEEALTPTERRDLILAVLALARAYSETWGRWPSVQDVEAHLEGRRSL